MAARRVAKDRAEFQVGTEFDSSEKRGTSKFIPGEGKAIQAMELAAKTFQPGESLELIARSDFAYGKDGHRTSKGDVLVPPFATLCFEIQVINCG